MSTYDREQTVNLLKMTDSGSESIVDLDLVIPAAAAKQKKKVRLKRKERKGRTSDRPSGSSSHFPLPQEDWWSCSVFPQTSSSPLLGCSSHSTCLLGLAVGTVLVVVVILSYVTAALHSKVLVLENQLRTKIVDDDAKSIPETLQQIQSRLSSLATNQTAVVESLSGLKVGLTSLQAGLVRLNSSVVSGAGGLQVKQSLADLEVKVAEIRQGLELSTNSSDHNANSIVQLSAELNNLKLNEIDFKNGASSVAPTMESPQLQVSDIEVLRASLSQQTIRLDNITGTLASLSQNTTVMIDWVKQDVVSLKEQVAHLQDDNVNVSSRLTSLTEKCEERLGVSKLETDRVNTAPGVVMSTNLTAGTGREGG